MLEYRTIEERGTTGDEDRDRPYREVSGWAVAGLCGGVVSALAMSAEICWLIPPIAVAINLAALREVRLNGSMIGRRAALTGLALALVFGISAPLQAPLHRWEVRSEAIGLARQWFVALRNNQPQTAHQLALPQ
ncbi:MAG: hypothetical protein ACREJM_01465, partial [Candidatus Saccharimonadales bacterium]